MLERMGKTIKTRKHEIQQVALQENFVNPPQVSSQDWKKVRQEAMETPNKFVQQREAVYKCRESIGQSHLGFGGWGRFYAYFVSTNLYFALYMCFFSLMFFRIIILCFFLTNCCSR